MKQLISSAFFLLLLTSCGGTKAITKTETETQANVVELQLYNVSKDQVKVVFDPGKFTTATATFYIPKTVPGTYSIDDYGRLIEGLKAYGYDGKELSVAHNDVNSWTISDATNLDKIEYLVNDSFDIDQELGIFSPAGTNIDKDVDYVLNLHGFIGYFENRTELPYIIDILRPKNMFATTSLRMDKLEKESSNENYTLDKFYAGRYFEVTDNPIFYTRNQPEIFNVDDMYVSFDVYSPTNAFSAKALSPNLENMMNAQKAYLGDINNTPQYSIMLYLSKMNGQDAGGFGALEHHTSTVVVMPEQIPQDYLDEQMTDIVSHEFFHTLTPLNVHSEEIHYFDYNNPEMSEHLWMYEGTTEYFANHFQVHEKLITPEDFYSNMAEKIVTASQFDDTMPFTKMSKNVLVEPYKDQYLNVYYKGALINMALDIRLRELSNGQMGVLDMMGKLSEIYGPEKPFKDEELIPKIVSITYPEIQDFFDTYVTGPTPIPYNDFFAKVGLEDKEVVTETNMWVLDMQVPFFDYDEETGVLSFSDDLPTNSMLQTLGVKDGDILTSVNGQQYTLENVREMIIASTNYQPGEQITLIVERDGNPVTLSAPYQVATTSKKELAEMNLSENDPRVKLREAWLFN